MRAHFDRIGKEIFTHALGGSGDLRANLEISPTDAQMADVHFVPRLPGSKDLAGLGLVGRMGKRAALIELYSKPPGILQLRQCLRKQLTLDHQRRAARNVAPTEVWLVSAGVPRKLMSDLEFGPRRTWPAGVFRAASWLRVSLVVVSQLPRVRETLLLRLLGKGRVLVEAFKDLQALPPDAVEHGVAAGAVEIIRGLVLTRPGQLGISSQEGADLDMLASQKYLELIEQGRREGREEGKLDALRHAVVSVARSRKLRLGSDVLERIEASTDVAELERWLAATSLARSMKDVFAAH